jgi:excisionase family DNA binding protein
MPNLLTPEQLAELLNIPVRTLGQWRYVGRGPRYIRAGRHVRYDPAEIDEWLRSHREGGDDAA